MEQRHVCLAGRTLLECIRRYEPASAAGLARVAGPGTGPIGRRAQRGLSDVAEGERRFLP